MLTMDQVNMRNQRVLIRLDLNVPLENGMITSFIRINKPLPTLKKALSIAKKVIVMSHLGRPQEGKFEKRYSLAYKFFDIESFIFKTSIFVISLFE